MIINSSKDFDRYILENDILIEDSYNIENEDLKITKFKSIEVEFHNCTFNCKSLSINNIIQQDLSIEFNNCTFNCDVSFYNCKIDSLIFSNTKTIKSLKINGNLFNSKEKFEINSFRFNNRKENNDNPELNNEIILSTSFSFNNVLFKKYFEFNNINNTEGIFNFSNNIIGDELYANNSSCVFHSSHLSNVRFNNNIFNPYTSFKNSTFSFNKDNFTGTGCHWNEPKFERNEFNKVNFSGIEIVDYIEFDDCKFHSTTWFEECKNLSNSKLKFVACEFKGFSLFNKSKINVLDIDRCTFHKSSSFTDAEFNTLKLFEVKFGGGAYFDEMKINKVLDKSYLKAKNEKILEWKRTLRAIKQELQKTENKIDFNRFRSYELAAHYKELSLWRNFKDTSILWSTKWTTDFGLSWTRAFWFTILSGLFWYSILYRIENSGVFNSEKVNDFFVGAFRFFLVTDFYNPLETDRVYLTNPLSWFVFILGKIVIAFGIYEMIQSFRKFKA